MKNSIQTASHLIATSLLLSGNAYAAGLSALDGTRQGAETSEEAAERKEAIDEAAGSMPRFARGKVKRRLNDRTKPTDSLEISVDGSKVRLARGGQSMELVRRSESRRARRQEGDGDRHRGGRKPGHTHRGK